MRKNARTAPGLALALCLALAIPFAIGCDDPDPPMTDAGPEVDSGMESDAGPLMCTPRDPSMIPDPGTCEALDTDYAPCQEDMWAECISDDGEYHRIQESVSTIGRVDAFERIAAILFREDRDATPEEFIDARLIYQEDEGLDSRIVRRYDPHYDPPADGSSCTDLGVPEANPEHCVGPAQIQPLLLDAFMMGSSGTDPRVQAGRIEGALLWFLYVSTYKESLTCTTTAKDCDSAWAYYNGGEPARGGIGLARYINTADPFAHDRAWDGALAIRCWRDLDAGETATDLELRDRARTQYDRALLDGIAAVLADRLTTMMDATAEARAYHWAFTRTLGRAVERELMARDPAEAATFLAQIAIEDPEMVDIGAARAALNLTFDCP